MPIMFFEVVDWNRTFKHPAPGSIPPVDRDPPAPEWSPVKTPASSPRPAQLVITADDMEWNRTFERPAPGSIPPIDRDPPAPEWSPLTTPASSPRPPPPSSPVIASESSVHGTRPVANLRKGRLVGEQDYDMGGDDVNDVDCGRKIHGEKHHRMLGQHPGPYQDMLGPPYPSSYHDIDDSTLPFGSNHITSARDLYGLAISAKTRKITAGRQQFLATHYGLGWARDPLSRRPLDAFLNEVAAISSYEGSDTFSHIQDPYVRDTIMAFSKVPRDERMAFLNAMRGPVRAEDSDTRARTTSERETGGNISTAYCDPPLPVPESSVRHRADHEEQYLAAVRALVDPARPRSTDEDQRRTAAINAWAQREAMKMNVEEEEVCPMPVKKAKRRRKDW